LSPSPSVVLSVCVCLSVGLSICPVGELWKNSLLKPDAVWGGHWGRSRCIRWGWRSWKGRAVLGVNVGHRIAASGTSWRSCAKLRASMWYCGVDVAYRRLSDRTCLQWALHTQRESPFPTVRVATRLFDNNFGISCFRVMRGYRLLFTFIDLLM